MTLADAAEHMVARNIRHLPVVDRGKVVGIVSIRDLTRWAADELASGHEMPDIAQQSQGAAGRERTAAAASQGRLSAGHSPDARSNACVGSCSDPSAATSRGKNNDSVQSSTTRTFLLRVGSCNR